jgi:hypothetical protein
VSGVHASRALVAFVAIAAGILCSGCALARPMIAEDHDLADYRAYRVAAHPGARLFYADEYLREHPKGAWVDEVRADFDHDEEAYFERAKTSRDAAREYLAFLPHGPHAPQTVALIAAFDTNLEELELAEVARKVRHNEATLESAAVARRRVSEVILAAVGALSDDNVYSAPFGTQPEPIARVLAPRAPATWGKIPDARVHDLYFVLPTRPERESRVASISIRLERGDDGRVVRGVVEGEDLFVRWLEADRIVALDPTQLGDRTEAGEHALDILGGALESRFPRNHCLVREARNALYARACDGLSVVMTMAESAGALDRIVFTADTKGAKVRPE